MQIVETQPAQWLEEARAVLSTDGESAYAEWYAHTPQRKIDGVLAELGRLGFEVMSPEECPAEVSGDGLGLRYWAAKIGGGE